MWEIYQSFLNCIGRCFCHYIELNILLMHMVLVQIFERKLITFLINVLLSEIHNVMSNEICFLPRFMLKLHKESYTLTMIMYKLFAPCTRPTEIYFRNVWNSFFFIFQVPLAHFPLFCLFFVLSFYTENYWSSALSFHCSALTPYLMMLFLTLQQGDMAFIGNKGFLNREVMVNNDRNIVKFICALTLNR